MNLTSTMEYIRSHTGLSPRARASLTAEENKARLALEQKLTEVQSTLERFRAEVITLKADNSRLLPENARLNAEVKRLTDAEAKLQSELADSRKDFDMRAAARASEIIAGAGFDPLNLGGTESGRGSASGAFAEYRKLAATNPAEAAKYWQQNKVAIIASAPREQSSPTAAGKE